MTRENLKFGAYSRIYDIQIDLLLDWPSLCHVVERGSELDKWPIVHFVCKYACH